MMMIDHQYFENLTTARVDQILAEIAAGSHPHD